MTLHDFNCIAQFAPDGQTIAFLSDRFDLPRGEAYRLISLAIDLRITQLVDRKVGVHAMIPKELFR